MYLYKIMTYVDYDYFEYSYYQNEKKYTNEEFFKIICKIIKESKNENFYSDGLGYLYSKLQDKIQAYGFIPLEFDEEFFIPSESIKELDNTNNISNNLLLLIEEFGFDVIKEKELEFKKQKLYERIDDIAWHAHNKDVNRAIKAIDCLIYGIERDLDD